MLNIKNARIKKGLKQIELAAAMDVGQPTISSWESNCSAPSALLLPKIAEILGCSIDELFDKTVNV